MSNISFENKGMAEIWLSCFGQFMLLKPKADYSKNINIWIILMVVAIVFSFFVNMHFSLRLYIRFPSSSLSI